MSVKKKAVLILIPVITCIISAVSSVLICKNANETDYTDMIKNIIGEDDYKKVTSCDYSFERSYIYKDGSTSFADSGSVPYEFDEWD